MSEIEFIYNGINTVIQCNSNEKMKEIIKKFKDKANIEQAQNIFYSYDEKLGINEDKSFEDTANSEDRKRSKMSVLVYENENQMEEKKSDIKKSKNIICPICKENIKMEIKDYKINLYDCNN